MSAQLQVRGTMPGYAGLYSMSLAAGRGFFLTGAALADESIPTRFSLRDDDGTQLIDFELENFDHV